MRIFINGSYQGDTYLQPSSQGDTMHLDLGVDIAVGVQSRKWWT